MGINIVLDLIGQTYNIQFIGQHATVTRYMRDLSTPGSTKPFFGLVDNIESLWVLSAYDNNTCDPNRMYQPFPITRHINVDQNSGPETK